MPRSKAKPVKPEVKIYAVCDGIDSRLAWEEFPYRLSGYYNAKTPQPGEHIHSLMESGDIAVFVVTSITGPSGRATFGIEVAPVGYLHQLEPENA